MTAALLRGPEWVGYHRGWLSAARQLNPIYATTTAVHSRLEERRDVLPAAVRAASRLDRASRPTARVDEYMPLNRPGLYGDAFVRVFVENTTALRRRRDRVPELVLQIADCTNTINLEFSLETPQLRENSLFKVDTLLGVLHRFRNGLAAEAKLAADRKQRRA